MEYTAPVSYTHLSDNIAPLIVSAELHHTTITPVELKEVIALHQHVVQLKEREAALQTLLVALKRQHAVNGEMHPNLTEKINVVEIQQPISVVCHRCV